MAYDTPDYYSEQETALNQQRGENLQQHYDTGKIRCYHFRFVNTTGTTIAADSVIGMGWIPQGKILPDSKLITTDFGSTTTLDVGLNEYKKNDGTLVAKDEDEFIDGIDVSGQAVFTTFQADGVADVQGDGYVLEGFAEVIAVPKGSTMQDGAAIDLYIYMLNGQ